jgi:hypothetical protein
MASVFVKTPRSRMRVNSYVLVCRSVEDLVIAFASR